MRSRGIRVKFSRVLSILTGCTSPQRDVRPLDPYLFKPVGTKQTGRVKRDSGMSGDTIKMTDFTAYLSIAIPLLSQAGRYLKAVFSEVRAKTVF